MVEKKEHTLSCHPMISCYTLLRRYSEGFLPVELLGEPCGGSSARCEGRCVALKNQRPGQCISSSSCARFITKTIPSPHELTFPNYLKFFTRKMGRPPDLAEPPFLLHRSEWDRRHWMSLKKGLVWGWVYAYLLIIVGFLIHHV